jgi:pimeloyl-ACP methyl ester carboxylesterase
MVAQFAGQGYIVIGADYFGKGISTEKEGYVVMASHQQACLDMYRAALFVLAKEGIQVSDFFITGWSQGGLVTMAFLEKLESLGIPVKAASTASSPTDPSMAIMGFMNFPRPNDAGWTTILFILSAFSFEEYYGIPGLARALFTEELYETARKIYDNELTDPNAFPTDIKKLVRPEYFDAQYFLSSAYGRILHDIQPFRWIIRTPTKMFYGESDEVISVGLGRLVMNYQQSIGAGNSKVEAISAGPTTHRGTYGVAVREQKKWFDSLIGR